MISAGSWEVLLFILQMNGGIQMSMFPALRITLASYTHRKGNFDSLFTVLNFHYTLTLQGGDFAAVLIPIQCILLGGHLWWENGNCWFHVERTVPEKRDRPYGFCLSIILTTEGEEVVEV